jgi:hypothetical protein
MRDLIKLKEEKLLFYDIETASVVETLEIDTPLYDSWEYKVNKSGEMTSEEIIASYSKESGLYPEFAKVICIVVGKVIEGKIVLIPFQDEDEATLLDKFNNLLGRNSQDKLVGFVNVGFDTPFVFKRMLINGIKPDDKVDSSGLKPWEVEEVDLAKMWQATSFNRASLINVTTVFGLPSPKSDINGSQVGKHYYMGELDRIVEYCKRDVVSTINIFKKMRLEEPLELAVEPVKEEPKGLLDKLFEGGVYSKSNDELIVKRLTDYDEETREIVFTIMNSIVSTAKGKKTKLTKTAVTRLKKLTYGE